MKNLPQHIETPFFKVLNKEISIAEFEQWVYATDELETLLSEHDYLNLIAFSFDQKNAFDYLESMLIEIIDFPKFETYRIIYLLDLVIKKDNSWRKALNDLYHEYIENYNFLETFGTLDDIIDLNEALEFRHNSMDDLMGESFIYSKNEAIKMKDWLNSRTIVIKGREGHRKGTNYIDNRKEEEK